MSIKIYNCCFKNIICIHKSKDFAVNIYRMSMIIDPGHKHCNHVTISSHLTVFQSHDLLSSHMTFLCNVFHRTQSRHTCCSCRLQASLPLGRTQNRHIDSKLKHTMYTVGVNWLQEVWCYLWAPSRHLLVFNMAVNLSVHVWCIEHDVWRYVEHIIQ